MFEDSVVPDAATDPDATGVGGGEEEAVMCRAILELIVALGQPERTPQQQQLSRTLMPDIMDIVFSTSLPGLEGLRDWLQAELLQDEIVQEPSAWEWPAPASGNVETTPSPSPAAVATNDFHLHAREAIADFRRTERRLGQPTRGLSYPGRPGASGRQPTAG